MTMLSMLKSLKADSRNCHARRARRRGAAIGGHLSHPAGMDYLEDRTLLSAGDLDLTFGIGGKVLTDIGTPGSADFGRGLVAYQSDGKAVVVGDSMGDMIVARYNADGTADTTFGTGGSGSVRIDIGGANDDIQSVGDIGLGVAVDSADRVIVAGYAWGATTSRDFGVARLTADGVLDTTFAGDGIQTIDFGSADLAQSVTVDSSDRVIVAGGSFQGGSTGPDFAVARLTTDGELDPSFAGDGRQTIDFGGTGDGGQSVAVDGVGRLLIAGSSDQGGSTGLDFAVVRLTADGMLDSDFGDTGDGRQTIDFGGTEDFAASVTMDGVGRLLVAGYSDQGGSTGRDFAVARLTASGALDPDFAGDGRQTIDFGGTSDRSHSVAVDGVGRVLVVGWSWQFANQFDFAVARLTDAGTLDPGFAGDGRQTITFGSGDDRALGVTVDGADRVLLGGYSQQVSTSYDFAMARLTDAGAPDPTFGVGGKVLTDLGIPTIDSGRDVVAYQTDGKSIVVGYATGDMVAVRYNADGTLDLTFGTDGSGKVWIDFGGTNDIGLSVAVDGADRILVAGYSHQGGSTGTDFAVARLTAAGTLDPTFAGDGTQTIDFGGTNDYGRSVAVDGAGRVIIAGTSDQGGSTGNDFAMARLTVAGVLDPGFGGDGTRTIDFGNTYDASYNVAVDGADGVIVAGFSDQGGSTGNDFAVARLTAAGTLDPGFGDAGDGTQTIDFGGTNDIGQSVAVDGVGRVLVAGSSQQGVPTGYDFAVARLTAAGTLDPTFAGDGTQTIDFGGTRDEGHSVAVDGADGVLVAGSSVQGGTTGLDFALARLTPAGTLDMTFAGDGTQTIDFGGTRDEGHSVAVDGAGRVLVTGYSDQGATRYDFAVARLLSGVIPAPDNLQSVVDALATGTQTEVLLPASPQTIGDWVDAVEALEPNTSGTVIDLTFQMASGNYGQGRSISVPAGYRVIIDGSSGTVVLEGSSPALIVDSGEVLIRNGVTFTNTTDAPTILVNGGSLTIRNSTIEETTGGNRAAIEILGGSVDLGTAASPGGNTINLNGPGDLIHNTGPAAVSALGNTFQNGGQTLSDFAVEDEVLHAMDGNGVGLVTWVTASVFVTSAVGSIQPGVDLVSPGGTVHVQEGSYAAYDVGDTLLTLRFDDGSTIVQQADPEVADARMLSVTGTASADSITFAPGAAGTVRVSLNALPQGTFLPTGRLVGLGGDGDDDLKVSGSLALSAWLYGEDGDDRIKGGAGHDVLLGGAGDDLMIGGSGRDLMIGGAGADRIIGNADDDILLAGHTVHDAVDSALALLMAEWTSDRDYATRIANLNGTGTGERANEEVYLIASGEGATVGDDGSRDVLTGSAGLDWFFFVDDEDKVTDLHDAEFDPDRDFIDSDV